MSLKYLFLVLAVVYLVNCETQIMNSTEQYRPVNNSSRKSREIGSYIGMVSCAMQYDVLCFVDAAENYLEVRRTELLAQADAEVSRATGRSDPDSTPSHLAEVIGKMITELTKMFQNGISGYFTSARDADSDIDEEDNDLTDETDSDANGVARSSGTSPRKKNKQPKEGIITKIVRLVKYLLYAAVLFVGLITVVQLFNSFVMFKLLLVVMWGVAFLGAKVWILHKQNNQIVVHEDVHHDHHYEESFDHGLDHFHHGRDSHGDHDSHFDHNPVEDWHRSYLPKTEYSQNLVYRKQKPFNRVVKVQDIDY